MSATPTEAQRARLAAQIEQRGMKHVWADLALIADFTHAEHRVAIFMHNRATADGTQAHPGRQMLARALQVHPATIDRALKRLRETGWLIRVSQGSRQGRRRLADSYRLAIPDHAAVLLDYFTPEEPPTGSVSTQMQSDPRSVSTQMQSDRDRISQHFEPISQHPDADPLDPSPLNPNEKALRPYGSDQAQPPSNDGPTGAGVSYPSIPPKNPETGRYQYPAAFDAWYRVYPRGKNKRDAYPAWVAALGRTTERELLAGAQRYAAECAEQGREPRYIRHAVNWLEGDGWEDEYETVRHPVPAGHIVTRPPETVADLAADTIASSGHPDVIDAEVIDTPDTEDTPPPFDPVAEALADHIDGLTGPQAEAAYAVVAENRMASAAPRYLAFIADQAGQGHGPVKINGALRRYFDQEDAERRKRHLSAVPTTTPA